MSKNMSFPRSGYLFLYLGTMRASKSDHGTKKATQYADLNEKVIYINHLTDNRDTVGGEEGKFSSHSSSNKYLSKKIDCSRVKLLSELNDLINTYSVIVIDEGHFFDDLVEYVLNWVECKRKHVIVMGLDGSYERTKIGKMLDLIPYADGYKKLNAKCLQCASMLDDHGIKHKYNDAPFAVIKDKQLASKATDNRIIGSEIFESVCRYHYLLDHFISSATNSIDLSFDSQDEFINHFRSLKKIKIDVNVTHNISSIMGNCIGSLLTRSNLSSASIIVSKNKLITYDNVNGIRLCESYDYMDSHDWISLFDEW